MGNFFEEMEKATGISKVVQFELLAEVKANIKLLDECVRPHDFNPITPGNAFTKYKCSKCGGVVDMHACIWYRRGLEDALVQ